MILRLQYPLTAVESLPYVRDLLTSRRLTPPERTALRLLLGVAEDSLARELGRSEAIRLGVIKESP